MGIPPRGIGSRQVVGCLSEGSLSWQAPQRRGTMAGRQVALIRGINVGKAKRVAMADLRAALEDLGYTDVRTLLNSGNVVFTAGVAPGKAAASIEKVLAGELGV